MNGLVIDHIARARKCNKATEMSYLKTLQPCGQLNLDMSMCFLKVLWPIVERTEAVRSDVDLRSSNAWFTFLINFLQQEQTFFDTSILAFFNLFNDVPSTTRSTCFCPHTSSSNHSERWRAYSKTTQQVASSHSKSRLYNSLIQGFEYIPLYHRWSFIYDQCLTSTHIVV